MALQDEHWWVCQLQGLFLIFFIFNICSYLLLIADLIWWPTLYFLILQHISDLPSLHELDRDAGIPHCMVTWFMHAKLWCIMTASDQWTLTVSVWWGSQLYILYWTLRYAMSQHNYRKCVIIIHFYGCADVSFVSFCFLNFDICSLFICFTSSKQRKQQARKECLPCLDNNLPVLLTGFSFTAHNCWFLVLFTLKGKKEIGLLHQGQPIRTLIIGKAFAFITTARKHV